MRKGCLLLLAVLMALTPAWAWADVKDAIVKIYTIHNRADYYNPWSMKGPMASTGSGCVIKGRRILTNAHVVSNRTFVQVRKNGDPRRYEARVLHVSHAADLALLTVEDPAFYEGIEPLDLGELPDAQEEVLVYGFPLGGDTLSITKGVISRLEHQVYVHSSTYLFAGQIDAAINPGNSGGPVLQNGRIVGVVMQGIAQADNIGYMVPVNIVQHFFKDLEDGVLNGIPSLGIGLQDMENPDLKLKYKVGKEQSGVLITRLLPGSPASTSLQVGDVLTAVDGHSVADDGTVEFRPRQRTSLAYYLQAHQVGENLDLDVLRNGEALKLQASLARDQSQDALVPLEQYDVMPTYYIYGGIVFVPLSKNLLLEWGQNWYQNAPDILTIYLSSNYQEKEGEQVVLAMKVLAGDFNQGYHDTANWVVKEVNGKPVNNLAELIATVEGGRGDEFIEFKGVNEQQIVLNRKNAEAGMGRLLKTYRIARDRSDNLGTP